jgi:hypothetical protein
MQEGWAPNLCSAEFLQFVEIGTAIAMEIEFHGLGEQGMLTEFDQSTIANMTAALDYVCKTIPVERDGNELRKQIADELIRCARLGRRSLIDLQQAGMKIAHAMERPGRSRWFSRWRK